MERDIRLLTMKTVRHYQDGLKVQIRLSTQGGLPLITGKLVFSPMTVTVRSATDKKALLHGSRAPRTFRHLQWRQLI